MAKRLIELARIAMLNVLTETLGHAANVYGRYQAIVDSVEALMVTVVVGKSKRLLFDKRWDAQTVAEMLDNSEIWGAIYNVEAEANTTGIFLDRV